MSEQKPQINPETFRDLAIERLDLTISRLLLSEEERKVLRALRTWVRTAAVEEVRKVAEMY